MPELPEVEVVRIGLSAQLTGRSISSCTGDGKPLRRTVSPEQLGNRLRGAQVVAVRRRAKYLLIDFDNDETMILHLGMSGRLGLFPAATPLLVHDHLIWHLDDGRELRFNDTRRFGSVVLLDPGDRDEQERSFFLNIGPEPFSDAFSTYYLSNRANSRRLPVKQFLMDSHIVAGIGNIYANEILFAAAVSPKKPAGDIGSGQWQRIVDSTRVTLRNAIDCGGSSISDFLGTDGQGGYFQVRFAVYDRAGKPCTRCGNAIDSVRLGGRSTFYCPKCQR